MGQKSESVDFSSEARERLKDSFDPYMRHFYERTKIVSNALMVASCVLIGIAVYALWHLVASGEGAGLKSGLVVVFCLGFVVVCLGLWGKVMSCHAAFMQITYAINHGSHDEIYSAIGKLSCFSRIKNMLKDVKFLKSLISDPTDSGGS